MMQPPATGTAERPLLISLILKDIYRNNCSGFAGGDQGGIVSETKVLPKPEDSWLRDSAFLLFL